MQTDEIADYRPFAKFLPFSQNYEKRGNYASKRSNLVV